MIGIIALFLLVFAGFLIMTGLKRAGKKLLIFGILIALVVPILASLWRGISFGSKGSWLWLVLSLLVLLAVNLAVFRLRGLKLFSHLLWLYVKASYRLGARLIEAVVRFPLTLMPLPERLVVTLSSILIIQTSVLVILCLLVSAPLRPVLVSLLVFLVAAVGFGLFGRWRFLIKERKGLSNV